MAEAPPLAESYEPCEACGGDGFVDDCQTESECVDPDAGCDRCRFACACLASRRR